MKPTFLFTVAGAMVIMPALTTLAGFTTSEFGEGKYVDGSGVSDILDNLLGVDGVQPIDPADITALALGFVNGNSYIYAGGTNLDLFDADNDGAISEQEFVDRLAAISSISGVDTTGGGIYAQAYATELGAITMPVTEAKISAAIAAGNMYAVHAPQVTRTTVSFTGTDASHSQTLGLIDGLGNRLAGGAGSVSHSLIASHDDDAQASRRFDISQTGSLILASGVNVEDLSAGRYTISVTVQDSNTDTYGLSASTDVTLTVSNERGCILNNGITETQFSAGSDSTSIEGATVTISGDHNTNDKLFVRTATSISTDTATGDVTYGGFGVSGISAVYDKSSGELKFSGTTTLANWIDIFRKVGYIYDSSGSASTGTRSLIFSLSNRIPYNHGDGNVHFYDFVARNDITFNDARIEASGNAMQLFGLQGYLATITSASEQAYIEPKIDGYGWLGACDRLENSRVQGFCGVTASEVNALAQRPFRSTYPAIFVFGEGEGYWYWVTGPERLDYMFRDSGNCTVAELSGLGRNSNAARSYPRSGNTFDDSGSEQPFRNFRQCEPNNYTHSSTGLAENHLHFYLNGTWNDYPNSDDNIQGYLIEWGGMPGDPALTLTVDKTYDIATEGEFCAHQ